MANQPQIPDFTGGKTAFTAHLNDVVHPVNQLLREFNERSRTELYDPALNACHILITAAEAVGHYTATALSYPSLGVTPTSAITAEELGGTDGEQVLAILPGEYGASANTLTIPTGGLYAFAHLTGLGSEDGRRVVTIIAGGTAGIIDMRYDTGTHSIQVTFDGTTWISKVTFSACSTGPATPAFGF